MRLVIDVSKTKQEILIQHDGKELAFPVNIFRPGSIQAWLRSEPQEPDFYYFHNKYIEDHVDGDSLFYIYSEIHRLLNNRRLGTKRVMEELPQLLDALYRVFDIAAFREYFISNVNIVSPYGVEDQLDEAKVREGLISREKTFLTSDYKELVVLSEVLRMFMPIYGCFNITHGQRLTVDSRSWTYLKWLQNTGIFELPGFTKIVEYALAMENTNNRYGLLANKRGDDGGRLNRVDTLVLSGVSRTDRHKWKIASILLENFVFRKVPSRKEDKSMAVAIHTALNINEKDRELLANQYRSKKIFDSDGDDDRPTALESFKTGTDLSIGGVEEMDSYCSDLNRLVVWYENTTGINIRDMIPHSYDNAKEFMEFKDGIIADCQRNIVSHVVSPILDPETVLYVSRESMTNIVSLSQAVLIAIGLHTLAGLLTTRLNSGSNITPFTPNTTVSIPEEYIEPLYSRYPKLATCSIRTESGELFDFDIITSITALIKEFHDKEWGHRYLSGPLGEYFHNTKEFNLRKYLITDIIKLHLSI